MQMSLITRIFASLLLFVLVQAAAQVGAETANLDLKSKKILVVMSYHADYPWHVETREGIESVLSEAAITYFYMDTKRNLAGGAAKAQEAFDLYQRLQPDAVITAEDNAQSLFVVPFLKDKVATPVLFCGVNDDASKYGFPAKNVSGILEKKHYRESINLLLLLVPKINRIALIYRDTPSNLANLAQIEKEQADYKVDIVAKVKIDHANDLEPKLRALKGQADALLVMNLSGLPSENEEPLSSADTIKHINRIWNRPTLGVSAWEVEEGILCSVAKLGQEQGAGAAQMAIRAMTGQPIASLPLTQNRNGRRVINISTAKQLGITLKPIALIGAELVK